MSPPHLLQLLPLLKFYIEPLSYKFDSAEDIERSGVSTSLKWKGPTRPDL